MTINRRVALTGAVSAGGALTLAACASEPEVATTTPPSATVEDVPTEPTGDQLLGPVSEVMVGSGKKYEISAALTILVTRPREDTFRAFNASCTHSGCIVTGVRDEQIACGCHGARFDPDSGEVQAGPAKSPLGKIMIEMRGSDLYAII